MPDSLPDFAGAARALSPCTCWGPSRVPPTDGAGPLGHASHYANCPSENVADIADALRTAYADGVNAAAEATKAIVELTALLGVPDVPAHIENELRQLATRLRAGDDK